MTKPFDSVKPPLIGRRATIVGYSEDADPERNFIAHVCLDVDDGPRVFFEAIFDGAVGAVLRVVEEPR